MGGNGDQQSDKLNDYICCGNLALVISQPITSSKVSHIVGDCMWLFGYIWFIMVILGSLFVDRWIDRGRYNTDIYLFQSL